MTTKMNQHYLKNIAQIIIFQNRSSMVETQKNVVLPLIIELILKPNIPPLFVEGVIEYIGDDAFVDGIDGND